MVIPCTEEQSIVLHMQDARLCFTCIEFIIEYNIIIYNIIIYRLLNNFAEQTHHLV